MIIKDKGYGIWDYEHHQSVGRFSNVSDAMLNVIDLLSVYSKLMIVEISTGRVISIHEAGQFVDRPDNLFIQLPKFGGTN